MRAAVCFQPHATCATLWASRASTLAGSRLKACISSLHGGVKLAKYAEQIRPRFLTPRALCIRVRREAASQIEETRIYLEAPKRTNDRLGKAARLAEKEQSDDKKRWARLSEKVWKH